MNVSFLIAPHSTVVRSLLRLLQYRTTPWTGGVFLVCLGLLEGNQGRPPPHFTSVGFRTEKETGVFFFFVYQQTSRGTAAGQLKRGPIS